MLLSIELVRERQEILIGYHSKSVCLLFVSAVVAVVAVCCFRF